MNNEIIWRLSRREEEWNEDGGLSHIYTDWSVEITHKNVESLNIFKMEKKV